MFCLQDSEKKSTGSAKNGKGKGKVKGKVTPKQAYVALRGPGG
jgi:hypothetical protein